MVWPWQQYPTAYTLKEKNIFLSYNGVVDTGGAPWVTCSRNGANSTYNQDSEEDDSWKVKNLVTPFLENEDSWLDADDSAWEQYTVL